jgi:hypothetical protein
MAVHFSISQVKSALFQQFLPGFSNQIGIIVAPNFCVIGEFNFFKKQKPTIVWFEQIEFLDYAELHDLLWKIVKKRCLFGCPVSVSLATPDVYTTNVDTSILDTLEEQNILPHHGILWESLEYTVHTDSSNVFSCIRHEDIDFWTKFFKEAGLVAGRVVPAGILWNSFFENADNVSFSLLYGTLQGTKTGCCSFIPNVRAVQDETTTVFNGQNKAEYYWCPSVALCALEPVLASLQAPQSNLNPSSYIADRFNTMQTKIRQVFRYSVIGIAALLIVFVIGNIGLQKWYQGSDKKSGKSVAETLLKTKQENALLKERLTAIKELAAYKKPVVKMVYDAGLLVKDSIWFSEMEIQAESNVHAVIIGHSMSDPAITMLLERAGKNNDVKNARLEYSERIPEDQVKRMTNNRKTEPVYRFKLMMDEQ